MIKENLKEFIIGYSPDHLVVADANYCFDYKQMYEFAIAQTAGTYGDIVAWNNHFWCSVKARNADKAYKKFEARYFNYQIRRKKV